MQILTPEALPSDRENEMSRRRIGKGCPARRQPVLLNSEFMHLLLPSSSYVTLEVVKHSLLPEEGAHVPDSF